MTVKVTCPTCHKPAAERAQNQAFPFCCERCRLIDLGKWLDEEYRIPAEDQHGEDGGGAEKPED
jgi:uncharacterized protein